MGVIVSKRSRSSSAFGLYKKWEYYVGAERTGAVVAAVVIGLGAYSVGKAMGRSQVAPVPPTTASAPDDSQARNQLEASVHRLALAWAAAQASSDTPIKDPQELVGRYLAELPRVPGVAANAKYPWYFSGYAVKMSGVPETLCHSVNNGPAYPSEQRKAGLQCHATDGAGLMLTYRLDSVPDSDVGYYTATLTLETKNRVPVARVELSEKPEPRCDKKSEGSGVAPLPADRDALLAKEFVCIPAFAWEHLEYTAGSIITTAPEGFSAVFRSGEASRQLTVKIVPVGKDSPGLAWSLAVAEQPGR